MATQVGPQACRRQAQTARSSGDVEEPLAGLEPYEVERIVGQRRPPGRHVPVVALRDFVPGLARHGVLFRALFQASCVAIASSLS